MSKKKIDRNYLDAIPEIIRKWNETEDGFVEVVVENEGFYNKIAQKYFKRPRYSFIKLDEFGSFVWRLIDGEKTIYEIGETLGKNFPEARDKQYERLSVFFKILEKHRYVIIKE